MLAEDVEWDIESRGEVGAIVHCSEIPCSRARDILLMRLDVTFQLWFKALPCTAPRIAPGQLMHGASVKVAVRPVLRLYGKYQWNRARRAW